MTVCLAGSAAAADQIASVDDVANSAVLCMLSAGKDGVDRSRFQRDGWVAAADTGLDYRHGIAPVTIEMPQDDDGTARICVVRATLASRSDQDVLASRLETLLRQKPLPQSDSKIWMVSVNGTRGIQLFTDTSEQPQVRLIGAAF